MNKTRKPTPAQAAVRCAIYTRKSTEEGLEQTFNSLDAQREVVEQIGCIGHDPVLRHETFALACTQAQTRIDELTAERRRLEHDLEHWHADIRALVAPGVSNGNTPDLTRYKSVSGQPNSVRQRSRPKSVNLARNNCTKTRWRGRCRSSPLYGNR